MIINLTYIFFILLGIYFGVNAYIVTRKWEIIFMIGVFFASFLLEISRLETGKYKLDVNDVLWTSRDILWTGVTIYYFHYIKKKYLIEDIYLYRRKSLSIPEKKTRKTTRKTTKKK